MILSKNQRLKTDRGTPIRVEDFLDRGGQGEVYEAQKGRREKGILKVLTDASRRKLDHTRTSFLRDQDLLGTCSTLLGPTDLVEVGNRIGHFTPRASGEPLNRMLEDPARYTFHDQLTVAAALARSVSVLEKRSIAHGDLHADNIFIDASQSPLKLHLIDFDNFAAPGQPPPACVGQVLYMAPELRAALAAGLPAALNVESDRFALGVCLHEIVLLRHPADGSDATLEDFQEAMTNGWIQDPMRAVKSAAPAGYPIDTLNAPLLRLFRAALSPDPGRRPSAPQWTQALARALSEVIKCPYCNGPSLTDTARKTCPHCGRTFPTLQLVLEGSGKTITLDQGAVALGRNQLGGSPQVSARHCVFRRVGPETHLESFGQNGTFRKASAAAKWTKLPDRQPVLVREGDRLLFANQEARLIHIGLTQMSDFGVRFRRYRAPSTFADL